MPQTLYQFGVDPSNPSSHALRPTAIAIGADIKILWLSWCDLIYLIANPKQPRSIVYSGSGLSATQQEDFTSPRSPIIQSLTDPTCRLSFFGNGMHDGVRGYICEWRLRVFNTPAEETKTQEFGTWDLLAAPVGEIQMCNDNSVLVYLPTSTSADTKKSTGGGITAVPHPKYLGSRFATTNLKGYLADFVPTQLVANATTATALSSKGQVYTCTTDPRYPSTLGRPYTGNSDFEPVPYLSETRIKKVASGGYMTAAISEDGELFLWGQSNPGLEEDLNVLLPHNHEYKASPVMETMTTIRANAVQDDDIKVLNISIDGRNATAYDIAIGSGHILVAAEDETGKHVLLAAGCGTEGQLGTGGVIDYEKEFREVVVLRGKRIKQLAAAGWSTFVVIEERNKTWGDAG